MSDNLKTPVFFDEDINLSFLDGPVAIIGYGNQGRAQALNLRDGGIEVIVGNIKDDYYNKAVEDGFEVFNFQDAAEKAKFILFLLPDEIQPEVFEISISPVLNPEKTLCFASGYNITYGFIKPPKNLDTILVAPRMIGSGVRDCFTDDKGFYTFVGVHNDYSGNARDKALAIAKGIGSTKIGGAVLEVTFEQETELDLFNEQGFGPAFGLVLTTAVDVLVDAGLPPEAVLIELYMSGELSYTMDRIAKMGTLKQLELHSKTSQYGSMSRGIRYANPELRVNMEKSLQEIRDGSFAQEFAEEYELDLETLDDLKEMAKEVTIVKLDAAVRKKLRYFWNEK